MLAVASPPLLFFQNFAQSEGRSLRSKLLTQGQSVIKGQGGWLSWLRRRWYKALSRENGRERSWDRENFNPFEAHDSYLLLTLHQFSSKNPLPRQDICAPRAPTFPAIDPDDSTCHAKLGWGERRKEGCKKSEEQIASRQRYHLPFVEIEQGVETTQKGDGQWVYAVEDSQTFFRRFTVNFIFGRGREYFDCHLPLRW